MPTIPSENMREIGRIDPNISFFQQEIPNPFANGFFKHVQPPEAARFRGLTAFSRLDFLSKTYYITHAKLKLTWRIF